MKKEVSQAIAGGTIGGVCFALAASGEKETILLSYLTPLPFLMVGFTAGFVPYLIALGVGVLSSLLLLGFKGAGIFIALLGMPLAIALWFNQNNEESRKVGNILTGLAGWGLGLIILLVFWLSGSSQNMESLVQATLEKGLSLMAPEFPQDFRQDFAASQAKFFPATVLMGWQAVIWANGFLALKLCRRLGVDLPDFKIAEMQLPDWPIFLILPALGLRLVGEGNLAYIAGNAAMLLALPYLLLGFAAVHLLVRRFSQPKMLLWAFYVGFSMVSFWGIFMVAGLGLVEHFARKKGIPLSGFNGEV